MASKPVGLPPLLPEHEGACTQGCYGGFLGRCCVVGHRIMCQHAYPWPLLACCAQLVVVVVLWLLMVAATPMQSSRAPGLQLWRSSIH